MRPSNHYVRPTFQRLCEGIRIIQIPGPGGRGEEIDSTRSERKFVGQLWTISKMPWSSCTQPPSPRAVSGGMCRARPSKIETSFILPFTLPPKIHESVFLNKLPWLAWSYNFLHPSSASLVASTSTSRVPESPIVGFLRCASACATISVINCPLSRATSLYNLPVI